MFKGYLISCLLLGLLVLSQAHKKDTKDHKDDTKNTKIEFYELKKGNMRLNLTNYGATIVSVFVPDKQGKLADVVLGYDSIKSYMNDTVYFGSLIGRVANRIGHSQFTLDGKTYKLPANDHSNTLHGGPKGFSDVVWTVESYQKNSGITFTYDSADMEQGFPGKLKVTVSYMLAGENKLVVKMHAKPVDKATPVNLAQHTYWNLKGHNNGDILSHTVQIFGSQITPVNDLLIPTGQLQPVKGTPYDFLEPKQVGKQIHDLPGLYDINYVIDKDSTEPGKIVKAEMNRVAIVKDSASGRKLEIWSNQPGVQFYTSGMLTDTEGKGGAIYHKYGGIALETQGFPDSVNHPNFPSQIVHPGETYNHRMIYKFTTE